MISSSFLESFGEQAAWQGPLYLAPAVALYLLVVAVVAAVAARRARLACRAAIAAVGTALAALVLLLSVYGGVVLHLRPSPARGEFVLLAKLAFAAVYLAVLAVAFSVGRLLGSSWRTAAASVAITLAFLVLTFRYVEFLNACTIGEPVLWPSYIEC